MKKNIKSLFSFKKTKVAVLKNNDQGKSSQEDQMRNKINEVMNLYSRDKYCRY